MVERDFEHEPLTIKVTLRTLISQLNNTLFPNGSIENLINETLLSVNNSTSSNTISNDPCVDINQSLVNNITQIEKNLVSSDLSLADQTNTPNRKALKSKSRCNSRDGAGSAKKQKLFNWPEPFEFPTHRITSALAKSLVNINKPFLLEPEYKEVISALYLYITVDLNM